jgi:hypothetical protein
MGREDGDGNRFSYMPPHVTDDESPTEKTLLTVK